MEDTDSATSAPGAGADAPATALGLTGASRDTADAFLQLQMEEMRQRNPYEISHFRLRRFSGWAKALLELAIGLLVLALVAGISLMVWNAAHSDGLVIESFNVPPDMAGKGLTGEVIAGQLNDKLSQLQTATNSNRAARSYVNNWGNDIKVEIPDTGVSIGEVYRFLKSWLGHETHVTGDVWRTPAGLVIAARVGGNGGTVTGTEADLDGLIQKAAEDIYARTQPYRYAVYLGRLGNTGEAAAIWTALAANGEPKERGWAYIGLGVSQFDVVRPAEQEKTFRQAEPYGNVVAAANLATLEFQLGRWERALAGLRKLETLLRDDAGGLDPPQIPIMSRQTVANEQSLLGDYHAAAQSAAAVAAGKIRSVSSPSWALANLQLLEHDVTSAGKTIAHPVANRGTKTAVGTQLQARLYAQMHLAQEAQDWKSVLAIGQALLPVYQKYPGMMGLKSTRDDPLVAIAEAHLSRFIDAERRVSPMPPDCYPCLIARAQVAQMQGQEARADFWFTRAVAQGPSLPHAEYQWGLALLERGHLDDAIAEFKIANKKGPHFADPLQGWGEALMAKNQSHLALEKFADAEKYAPNWGRLHLKWGEALLYAGKPAEAKAQFTRAAALDLTPSEKSELARLHV